MRVTSVSSEPGGVSRARKRRGLDIIAERRDCVGPSSAQEHRGCGVSVLLNWFEVGERPAGWEAGDLQLQDAISQIVQAKHRQAASIPLTRVFELVAQLPEKPATETKSLVNGRRSTIR